MAETAERLLKRAFDHHRAGRLAEAAALYVRVLRLRPADSDALYLLGLVAHQSGQPAQAVELLRQSLAALPGQARCYTFLGLNLVRLGRMEEAEASLQQSLAIEPSAEAYNQLAALWMEQGREEDAIAGYEKAIAADARYTAAHCNLGDVWRRRGEWARAVECYRRAVASDPQNPPALAALGRTLLKMGQPAEAERHLEKAVVLSDQNAEVICDLGDAWQSLGKIESAIEAYGHALELAPQLGRAWFSKGCAESHRLDYIAAIECFRKALEIAPDWPAAQHNLGRALFKMGQVEEALALFRRAAAAGDPAIPLGAIALVIPGDPASDNRAVLAARREWAERHLPCAPASRRARAPIGHRPLRIGYLSSFFPDRNWMKPVWGLINRHDRGRFEIHLFSDAPPAKIEHGYSPDARDRMHDVSRLSNAAMAERIAEAEIDLLIDLNGYSSMERLAAIALRPAPVIAGWFNLYATTGMAAYDYLIGDAWAIPPEEEPFYCEKIVRVPGSYLTFEVTYPTPPVADPPCLTSGGITFGSLAPQYKITPQDIAVWSGILQQVRGSAMLLKNRELDSARARQFVEGLFARHGIPPERLRLAGPAEHYRFLETYGAIDIALDTFPYNGGTTTTEAIWQGVPVVTFAGDRWVSRTSSSILHAAGLAELVGQGIDDYVALAVRLAQSPERLLELRRNMRTRLGRSAACDTATFARQMERIYTEIAG